MIDHDDDHTFAAPISREGFFYSKSSGLYVEVSTDSISKHHHSRATHERLHDLLTYSDPGPVRTKKGAIAKRQPPPHKDETGHFYIAQLIHYGIPAVKSKTAAKNRLLAALSRGALQVPEKIVTLEKEMREEYDRKNLTARKEYYALKEEEEEEEREVFECDLQRQQADFEELTGGKKNKSKAKSTGKRKGNPSDEAERTGKAKKVRRELDPDELVGQFNISCPKIMGEYGGGPFTFKVSPSQKTGKHLWVSFDFGFIEGVMRSTEPPPKSIGDTVSLIWRGRETGEGKMQFAKYNTCTITFLDNGKIKGLIGGAYLGQKGAPFEGRKISAPNIWGKKVASWKSTWRGINEKAYERAGVARWGKWVSDEGRDEGPADSDTSFAHSDAEGSTSEGYENEYFGL